MMSGVIVAVEGPSAAGKTTWCSRRRWPVVAEYAPRGVEPDCSDEIRRAVFWVGVNAERWQQALVLEQSSPVVLCDGDPLKLHYSWCLARAGAASWARFDEELRQVRIAFAAQRLGLADLMLVSIPSVEVLRRQRAGDRTRQRRSFDLHVTLAEPLREWYSAVDAVDPGRVVWSWPAAGVPTSTRERFDRCDVALLDGVMDNLPGRSP
jgi:hypothetical protein